MFKKLLVISIMLVGLFILSGCVNYLPGKLPNAFIEGYSNYPTKDKVSVAVKIFDCKSALQTFACKACQKGMQPIFIVIDNKSESAYLFTKVSIDENYISADKAAAKCVRRWLNLDIWPPDEVENCKVNVNIRKDYARKEIKDGPIDPKQGISGVMFVNAMKKGDKLVIPLVNRETKEKILFEFTKD